MVSEGNAQLVHTNTGVKCYGSTWDSKSLSLGSTPSALANFNKERYIMTNKEIIFEDADLVTELKIIGKLARAAGMSTAEFMRSEAQKALTDEFKLGK